MRIITASLLSARCCMQGKRQAPNPTQSATEQAGITATHLSGDSRRLHDKSNQLSPSKRVHGDRFPGHRAYAGGSR